MRCVNPMMNAGYTPMPIYRCEAMNTLPFVDTKVFMQRYRTEPGSIDKGELLVCCENEMVRKRNRTGGKLG